MKKVVCILGLVALLVTSVAATGKQYLVGNTLGSEISHPYNQSQAASMRFQYRFSDDYLEAGTITEIELYLKGSLGPSKELIFENLQVYLCHTHNRTLSIKFAENYTGTPVRVASKYEYRISARYDGYLPVIFDNNFDYSGKGYPLLFEVQWNGHNVVKEDAFAETSYPAYPKGGSVCAYNVYAESGAVTTHCFHARVSVSYFTGIKYTSLGRIKILYR